VAEQLAKLPDITNVSIQALQEIVPSAVSLGRPRKVTMGRRSILIDPCILKELKISKEHYVVLSACSRFPLLVMKIIVDPEKVIRLRMLLSNVPNTLAPIAEMLREHLSLFGTTLTNVSCSLQMLVTYGRLLEGKDIESVKKGILGLNKPGSRQIIDPSFEVKRLDELEDEI